MTIKEEITKVGNIPSHIAVIMDGNGRWAQARGLVRAMGHKMGVKTIRKVLEACGEIGVKYLTLYAFSVENWNRPKDEVETLMNLMVDVIVKEDESLMQNNVRVKMIGCRSDLPSNVLEKLDSLIKHTSQNTGVTLVIALSYGSRKEILHAAKLIAADCLSGKIKSVDDVTEPYFETKLDTCGMPDPDLLIRTSGEFRLSNFLLWQSAYTEFLFVDKFWPDFGKKDLFMAVRDYQKRERRFGKTEEQLKNNSND